MIDDDDRRPANGAVTVLAGIRGQDVVRGFAGCVNAVVTAEAVATDIRMIEDSWNPGPGLVAVVTSVGRNDVVGRLTHRRNVVVAGITAPGDSRVIHERHRAPR